MTRRARIVIWTAAIWFVIGLLFPNLRDTRYVVLGKSHETVYGPREKEAR